jgi:membrane protein implicated in regulation of membrane protease activity
MSIYLATLVFGAILLGASFWQGDAHDADGHQQEHAPAGPLAVLFSLRFWTFGAAFFGLTGLVLEGTGLLGGLLAGAVAGVVGLSSGLVSTVVLRALSAETTGALPHAESHVGREGRLLLPLAPGQRGKVRVRTPTGEADFVAELPASVDATLPSGERVWIVEMRGATAVVDVPPADLPPATTAQ